VIVEVIASFEILNPIAQLFNDNMSPKSPRKVGTFLLVLRGLAILIGIGHHFLGCLKSAIKSTIVHRIKVLNIIIFC